MAWMYLFIGGLCEIGWAYGLKSSNGFTEPIPSVMTVLLLAFSFVLFAKTLKTIPIGTAYAVFTGIGAAGTVMVELLLYPEKGGMDKVFFLALLITGIIGLKLTTTEETAKENG
ncbi:MAG: multidrug efflux SMR transporter [Bacillota bacterium]|nr:multidrug efflux SMR transporter [Bacillota bacterium]MDP4172164.1 multidrug efflux SMR transporter [Bacillota bacterium]